MKNNIIISGVPRAGKSTISHLLATRYGFQHVSMDSIIAGFEKCFPETGVSTYQGLSSMDTLRVISSKMAPFVRAMLDSGEYDEFEPGMVLDMYQLLPEDYDRYLRGANCNIAYFITSDVTPEERFAIQKKYDTEKDYTFWNSAKSTACRTMKPPGTGRRHFSVSWRISASSRKPDPDMEWSGGRKNVKAECVR